MTVVETLPEKDKAIDIPDVAFGTGPQTAFSEAAVARKTLREEGQPQADPA